MSDLMKKDGFPLLPNSLPPMNIKEPNLNAGIIGRFFDKKRLKDVEEMTRLQAEIAENGTRLLIAQVESMTAFMTASDKMKLELFKLESEKKTIELKVFAKQASVNSIVLNNQLKEKQVQLAEEELKKTKLENQVAEKNLRSLLDDTETEDRDE